MFWLTNTADFLLLWFTAALSEELVPSDAVVLQLAPPSGRRRPFPSVQTRRLRLLLVLQERRLRVQ